MSVSLDDFLKEFHDPEFGNAIKQKVRATEASSIILNRVIKNAEEDPLCLAFKEMTRIGKEILAEFERDNKISIDLQVKIIGWDRLLQIFMELMHNNMQEKIVESVLGHE